jgi:hypothetical protein
MNHGTGMQGHRNQVALGFGHAFLNGANDFGRLANAHADLALAVADNDHGAEAHFFTALNDLGHPADLNHFFLPFGRLGCGCIAIFTTATIAATFAALAISVATGRSKGIIAIWVRHSLENPLISEKEQQKTENQKPGLAERHL